MKNSPSVAKEEEEPKLSLLDLPASVIEHILQHLSAVELCVLSEVCISLRDMCRSDGLWNKFIEQRWGKLIGDAVYQEWNWQMIARKKADQPNIQNATLCPFYGVWPNLYVGSYLEKVNYPTSSSSSSSDDSRMALYISLESGRFWFPAQVYEGDVCYYDALVRYNSRTDTFQARERHGGWRLTEQNIKWDRVRMADFPPFVLHVSDCTQDLKPGDQVEIQWRSCKEKPYDWWYAIIGHLRSCEEEEILCRCRYSDTVLLEFNVHSPPSHLRKVELSRKQKEQQGNGGFYGGIRKLGAEYIDVWKKLWQLPFD